jgi:hypothetical protein
MNNSGSGAPASGGSMVIKIVLLVVGAIAIYYSYRFLFTSPTQSVNLLSDIHKGDVDKPYVFSRSTVPPLYEGGEYSVGLWMYVNNWTGIRNNYNKEVLTIGNRKLPQGKITLGVYLDAIENMIHVKTSSVNDCGSPAATNASAPAPASTSTPCLRNSNYNDMFKNPTIGSNAIGYSAGDCSVTPFELQKWVHVVVALNGKTVDVYVDGKLARSCVINGIIAVDSGDYSINISDNGGFGGFLAGVNAYDYALNPEQVYRTYMNGPMGSVSFSDYMKSFFDPKSIGTLEYPKMN